MHPSHNGLKPSETQRREKNQPNTSLLTSCSHQVFWSRTHKKLTHHFKVIPPRTTQRNPVSEKEKGKKKRKRKDSGENDRKTTKSHWGRPGHVLITYNTTFQKFWPLGFWWMSKPRSSVLLRECPGWHPCRTTKTSHFFLSIILLFEDHRLGGICTTRHLISNALPLYTPYDLVCGLLLVISGALARHQDSWQVSMTCQSPQLCRLCHRHLPFQPPPKRPN